MIEGFHSEYVLPDRAYDCYRFLNLTETQGSQVVILPKRKRVEQLDCDRHIYKERHLIDYFFAKIKRFRRVSTSYDKFETTYRVAVLIAACMVWLQSVI